MTGFCSVEGNGGTQRFRLEIKALNHRYLDLKLRLPRDLIPAETQLRAALTAAFSRGSLDVKIERLAAAGASPESSGSPHLQSRFDLELASHYLRELKALQKELGLSDPIRTLDVAGLPDVLSRTTAEIPGDEIWSTVEPLAKQGIVRLTEMREHEGAALGRVLSEAIDAMESQIKLIRDRRNASAADMRARIQDKVKAVFEAYPLAESSVQTVLETRVAQELALVIDRTDIEEELTRFQGHLDHFRKTLSAGGPVGRKLEFILQELGREINTLGNKAQDLQISEEVVQTKVRLEQLREQVLNLE
jgi:uncharacterized protein (TIGR00255 family)